MEILQISDFHYRRKYPEAEDGYYTIFKRMTNPLTQFREAFKGEWKKNLSLVLICGDLTENGDAEDYANLQQELKRALGDLPFVVTLGNHDNKEAFRTGWKGAPKEKVYGWTEELPEVFVISLDNSEKGYDNGLLTTEHCKWLEEILISAPCKKKKILMMHHHLIFDYETPIPELKYPAKFVEILRKYPVDMILAGHTHSRTIGVFEGICYATCGSLSFKGEQLREGNVSFVEDSSMNLCKLEDNFISVKKIQVTKEKKELTILRM